MSSWWNSSGSCDGEVEGVEEGDTVDGGALDGGTRVGGVGVDTRESLGIPWLLFLRMEGGGAMRRGSLLVCELVELLKGFFEEGGEASTKDAPSGCTEGEVVVSMDRAILSYDTK